MALGKSNKIPYGQREKFSDRRVVFPASVINENRKKTARFQGMAESARSQTRSGGKSMIHFFVRSVLRTIFLSRFFFCDRDGGRAAACRRNKTVLSKYTEKGGRSFGRGGVPAAFSQHRQPPRGCDYFLPAVVAARSVLYGKFTV